MKAVARGFLKGAVLGAVVSVSGALGLSLLAGGPVLRGVTPETGEVNLPAGSEFNGARDDRQASLPDTDPAAAPSSTPPVAPPAPDDLTRLEGIDTSSARPPSPGSVDSGLETPVTAPAASPQVAIDSEAPVQPGTVAGAPQAPAAEPELSISTEPSQPQPPATETSAFPDPAPDNSGEAAPEATAVVDPQPDSTASDPATTEVATGTGTGSEDTAPAPAPSVQADAPTAPMAPQMAADGDSAAPQISTPANTSPSLQPAGPDAPAAETAIAVETSTPPTPPRKQTAAVPQPDPAIPAADPTPEVAITTPTPETPSGPADTEEQATSVPAPETVTSKPEPEPEPQAKPAPTVLKLAEASGAEDGQGSGIRIGKPAGSLVGKPAGSLIGKPAATPTAKLPSLGEASPDAPAVGADASAMPPIKRFAVPFDDPENRPKLAIVLIDEGKGPVGIEALSTFPYPLAFAVDTSRDDAEDKMASYRAAGFEVLAMIDLPRAATPADVEVAMPVLMAKVPEAVGVMEAPGDGIQFDRKVSDQVAQILASTGHGLLLYSKGLNTAQKLAAKNGVPSAVIFRDMDDKDQKPSAIRRFLNYGALNAGSEGGVVLVGRLRPDTVTALLLWGLEDRARQITVAPVSQLLEMQP